MYIQREETKQVFILPRVCKGEEEEYRTMPYTKGEHGWESNVRKDPPVLPYSHPYNMVRPQRLMDLFSPKSHVTFRTVFTVVIWHGSILFPPFYPLLISLNVFTNFRDLILLS